MRAAELRPRDAEVLNDLGVAREQAGDLAGAEQAYRSALHQRPGFGPVWANLANVLLHCGDPAGAERAS